MIDQWNQDQCIHIPCRFQEVYGCGSRILRKNVPIFDFKCEVNTKLSFEKVLNDVNSSHMCSNI